jgi:hypothetical protein
LEGSFPGAEIRHIQKLIRGNHPNQGDVWKIQSFGQHLRTDQNRYFLTAEPFKNFPMFSFTRRRTVSSLNTSTSGKRAATSSSTFCVPWPKKTDKSAAAIRAAVKYFLLIITVMTRKRLLVAVKGQ